MQIAQRLSQFALKSSFLSRFTSQRRLSWLLLWRGIWLVSGLMFAWASITASMKMSEVFDGEMRPADQLMGMANAAVERFPFDPYLRAQQRVVRGRINGIPKEQPDASGK